jgi:hypothetical protein
VLGSHSISRHNNIETLPVSHPLLAPNICNLVVRISLELPQNSSFPPSKPIPIPKKKFERRKIHEGALGAW